MLEYPEKNGLHALYTLAGISYLVDGVRRSDGEIKAFVQNYIYFGLLHEIFDTFIDINKFITTNASGESIITTAPMEECLKQWTGQVKGQQDPESEDETDWCISTSSCVTTVW